MKESSLSSLLWRLCQAASSPLRSRNGNKYRSRNLYGNIQNSDSALREEVASNLEASGGNIIWPFGHNYANQYVSLQPSICIGLETGRCTINIDPYAPMVPNQSTFYVPKL